MDNARLLAGLGIQKQLSGNSLLQQQQQSPQQQTALLSQPRNPADKLRTGGFPFILVVYSIYCILGLISVDNDAYLVYVHIKKVTAHSKIYIKLSLKHSKTLILTETQIRIC